MGRAWERSIRVRRGEHPSRQLEPRAEGQRGHGAKAASVGNNQLELELELEAELHLTPELQLKPEL